MEHGRDGDCRGWAPGPGTCVYVCPPVLHLLSEQVGCAVASLTSIITGTWPGLTHAAVGTVLRCAGTLRGPPAACQPGYGGCTGRCQAHLCCARPCGRAGAVAGPGAAERCGPCEEQHHAVCHGPASGRPVTTAAACAYAGSSQQCWAAFRVGRLPAYTTQPPCSTSTSTVGRWVIVVVSCFCACLQFF